MAGLVIVSICVGSLTESTYGWIVFGVGWFLMELVKGNNNNND